MTECHTVTPASPGAGVSALDPGAGVIHSSVHGRAGVHGRSDSIWRKAAEAFGVLAIVASFAAAQEPDQGPGFVLQGEGGLVTALVLDPSAPSTLYVTTARGLYKTTDAGVRWETRGRGLDSHSVLGLAIDPQSPSTLFATTDRGGVYKSTDGGEHWAPSNEGLSARYVGAIAIDPRRQGTIWVGAESGRLFRSTDGGAVWSEMPIPLAHVTLTAIALDPANSNSITVGSNSEGIFRSLDGGTTWIRPVDRMNRGTVWSVTLANGDTP